MSKEFAALVPTGATGYYGIIIDPTDKSKGYNTSSEIFETLATGTAAQRITFSDAASIGSTEFERQFADLPISLSTSKNYSMALFSNSHEYNFLVSYEPQYDSATILGPENITDNFLSGQTLLGNISVNGTTIPTTGGSVPGIIAASVWGALGVDNNSAGSFGESVNSILVDTATTIPASISALNDLSASEVSDAVWQADYTAYLSNPMQGYRLHTVYNNVVTALANDTNEISKLTYISGNVTSTAIKSAVWDAATIDHNSAGSFGEGITNIVVDTNELQSDDYPTSFTNVLSTLNSLSGQILSNHNDLIGKYNAGSSLSTIATGVTVSVGSDSGLISDLESEDFTRYTVNDTAGNIDFYVDFNVGEDSLATSVEWVGYCTSSTAEFIVYGYDWSSTSWKEIGYFVGSDDTDNPRRESFKLTDQMTGSSADVGKVRFRFEGALADQVRIDRILCNYISRPGWLSSSSNNNVLSAISGSMATATGVRYEIDENSTKLASILTQVQALPTGIDGMTAQVFMDKVGAILIGKSSGNLGAAPYSETFRSVNDNSNQVTITTDSNYNRTAVNLSP